MKVELNITQIEKVLPELQKLVKLVRTYKRFNKKTMLLFGQSELDMLHHVLSTMASCNKESITYDEQDFVQMFNRGYEFLKAMKEFHEWFVLDYFFDDLTEMLGRVCIDDLSEDKVLVEEEVLHIEEPQITPKAIEHNFQASSKYVFKTGFVFPNMKITLEVLLEVTKTIKNFLDFNNHTFFEYDIMIKDFPKIVKDLSVDIPEEVFDEFYRVLFEYYKFQFPALVEYVTQKNAGENYWFSNDEVGYRFKQHFVENFIKDVSQQIFNNKTEKPKPTPEPKPFFDPFSPFVNTPKPDYPVVKKHFPAVKPATGNGTITPFVPYLETNLSREKVLGICHEIFKILTNYRFVTSVPPDTRLISDTFSSIAGGYSEVEIYGVYKLIKSFYRFHVGQTTNFNENDEKTWFYKDENQLEERIALVSFFMAEFEKATPLEKGLNATTGIDMIIKITNLIIAELENYRSVENGYKKRILDVKHSLIERQEISELGFEYLFMKIVTYYVNTFKFSSKTNFFQLVNAWKNDSKWFEDSWNGFNSKIDFLKKFIKEQEQIQKHQFDNVSK